MYGPLVYQWCRRGGLKEEDAADCFQEVFQSVARAISTFEKRNETDSFRGWLATITRNKIRDHFRRQAKSPQAGGGTEFNLQVQSLPDPLADDEQTSTENHGVMHRALAMIRGDFEENTWRAFWQTAVEERLAADVSAELGISVNAVYKAKFRVLRRLREEIEGLM